MENFKFLKERAKEFWERGLEDLEKKRFNLAAFDFEQAIQLFIKYLIGIKVGDWPKTHYFSDLIRELSSVYNEERILTFFIENEIFFSDLEDAYFTSRYFDKKFSENLVRNLLEKCKEFLKVIEEIIGEKFLNE
ncbi:MAG: HEPN domain-containing protein [Candidatus Omnitrophica bacterium]|nr:HEPN domain-containing protein [Candidatus Omnitrophota bacterium]MCM8802345.1 HEPN domain-containing protein [Candidatus Omnitrophota bacterium]